jgi:hypothetical protein
MHNRLRDTPPLPSFDAAEDPDRLMATYSVHRVAGRYGFRGFCYDRLPDAIAYARQVAAHPDKNQQALTLSVDPAAQDARGEEDGALMATLHIEFKEGRYHFRGYRYDRLVDAVRYARSMATNGSSLHVMFA